MAYIPEKHLKYDILPRIRKKVGEVIVYDSEKYDVIHSNCDLAYPYNIDSLEKYYVEIDRCIEKYPKQERLLRAYKEDLIQWNNKDVWGIVRYNGETNSAFTHGRCYYVPIGEVNGQLVPDSGIIDDEEWTSYRAYLCFFTVLDHT